MTEVKFNDTYSKDPDICPFCGSGDIRETNGDIGYGSVGVEGHCGDCEREWEDNYVRERRMNDDGHGEVVYANVMGIEEYTRLENMIIGVAAGNEDAMTDLRAFALRVMTGNKEG